MPWICGEPECKKQPYYAEPGEKKPKFCFLHKQVGHIDVRNKRCDAASSAVSWHCVLLLCCWRWRVALCQLFGGRYVSLYAPAHESCFTQHRFLSSRTLQAFKKFKSAPHAFKTVAQLWLGRGIMRSVSLRPRQSIMIDTVSVSADARDDLSCTFTLSLNSLCRLAFFSA